MSLRYLSGFMPVGQAGSGEIRNGAMNNRVCVVSRRPIQDDPSDCMGGVRDAFSLGFLLEDGEASSHMLDQAAKKTASRIRRRDSQAINSFHVGCLLSNSARCSEKLSSRLNRLRVMAAETGSLLAVPSLHLDSTRRGVTRCSMRAEDRKCSRSATRGGVLTFDPQPEHGSVEREMGTWS